MPHLRINDADLYSEVDGVGDPVVLLHGGFCSLESMRSQFDALATSYRAHAFERPGHGRSADTDTDFSYAQGVGDALAYLDANGLARVDVVGYSDGAIIALLLALEHPERIRSLVAISANLDPTAFTRSPEAAIVPTLQPLPTSNVDKPDLERLHYDRLSPDGPEHADVVLNKLFRLWTSEPHINPDDLANIRARTLIVSADRDTIRPDHSLLIASSIPGAQLCIVPGTSHGLIAERPDLINTIIREFLAEST